MKKYSIHIQLDNIFDVIAEDENKAYKMAILEAVKLYEFDKEVELPNEMDIYEE